MQKYLDIVNKIHASPYKLTIVSSGGGTNAISALLEVAGASNTILESHIPYSKESMDTFLNKKPDHYCSLDTCLNMAANAFKKSKQIDTTSKTKHLLGISITANLATTYEKKGEHRRQSAICVEDSGDDEHGVRQLVLLISCLFPRGVPR